MIEQEHAINLEHTAEYFTLESTLDIMINLFQQVFGIYIGELQVAERNSLALSGNGGDVVWHESVRMFAVRNTDGEHDFLAYLYLDLFEPDNMKRGDTAFNIIPVSIDDRMDRVVVKYCGTDLFTS